jgi:predicted transposase/invertase (TIGR01784 family)
MIFINPKTDFAFKKIFASEQSHGILISFLNGLLCQGKSVIQDLEILNSYYPPRIRGIQDHALTVQTQWAKNKHVIIKIQVLNMPFGFEQKILYKVAKTYSACVSPEAEYLSEHPVIALTITDFALFPPDHSGISRFIVEETDFLVDYPMYDLELVFVELPKFQQSLEQLNTLTEKWIYFLQHARDVSAVPATLGDVAEIQQAFAIANQANLSPEVSASCNPKLQI